jgi:hypothetical protein
MPKKDGDEFIISETGNWNVADQYAKNKIMKPLNLADYYEDIATFGYESIAEEFMNYNAPPNDVIRIKALKRLIKTLIRVIDNSKFALKKQGTKKEALSYKQSLEKLDLIIATITRTSQETGNIKITKEILFQEIIKKVSIIKSKINEPLNANHLIFTDKEEFDPKAFKDRKKRRMEEEG